MRPDFPRLAALAPALLISLPLLAQQSGDADRNYVVNGFGSLMSSPVVVNVPSYNGAPPWDNTYLTGDPQAPVAWITATQGQVGWFTTPTNSVDIGPAGLAILADGTHPTHPLAPFFTTDGLGDFTLDFAVGDALAGYGAYFAMLHFAATSPDGFWLSQTYQVNFRQNNLAPSQYFCPSGSTVMPMGDEDSVLVPLGFDFAFYGTIWSEVWVGSNGYLTFGTPDTSGYESYPALQNGPPRIAAFWDDLDPTLQGAVLYHPFTGISLVKDFVACWSGIPEAGGAGSNTFSVTLRRSVNPVGPIFYVSHSIFMDYAALSTQDGQISITPGWTIGGTPIQLINLSLAGNSLTPGTAYYQWFFPGNLPPDVVGKHITWNLGASGQPLSQN